MQGGGGGGVKKGFYSKFPGTSMKWSKCHYIPPQERVYWEIMWLCLCRWFNGNAWPRPHSAEAHWDQQVGYVHLYSIILNIWTCLYICMYSESLNFAPNMMCRNIVAPMLVRPHKLFSNFWGAIASNGFYSRAHDYREILNGERKYDIHIHVHVPASFIIHLSSSSISSLFFSLSLSSSYLMTGVYGTSPLSRRLCWYLVNGWLSWKMTFPRTRVKSLTLIWPLLSGWEKGWVIIFFPLCV